MRGILVVDDNEGNLLAIEAALEPLARPLVFARSGNEALTHLLAQDFALVLLDVSMPDMDGFETARLMRGRKRNRATPIIFITGVENDDSAMMRGYDIGAFDYLVKPFRPEVLRAKARVFIDLDDYTAQNRHLVELDRKKDEFLAILAHELRNPLQPLLSALELIDAAPTKPLSERTREILRRQIHHMNRLVDDLLDVARSTSRKLELRRAIVAIDHVVEQAILQCRAAVDAKSHELVVRRAGDEARVDGDPVRLVQVVCNLLTNAVRYTPSGGRIEVSTRIDGDDVIVRVTDNGRGISAALLPQVFEMFVQERARADGSGGLGLGLGIVKRLVELHGGRVDAASAGEDRGSTFEVRLPLVRRVAADGAGDSTGKLRTSRPLRAVVCDDAEDVRELVADVLRSRGHQVTTVTTGVEALESIFADRPDVAVIDIGLPGMNGYEVARALRERFARSALRLIAVTGYGQTEDRDAALAAGFDAHITKPTTVEALLGAMGDDEPFPDR